ncbi:MAG: hypothetical protein AMXMBFR58_22010 [Phycisphaerae bacterium]
MEIPASRATPDRSPPAAPPPDFLRGFLAEHDVACPSCGYNLRALTATVCPECRQELHLTVSLVEPRIGLWLTAVVGLGFGCGLNSLLLYYWLVQMLRNDWNMRSSFEQWFFILNLSGLLIEGSALAAVLLRGRQIRRWRRGWLVLLAGGCWLLTIANATVFSLSVR